jgi:hypothetical protein
LLCARAGNHPCCCCCPTRTHSREREQVTGHIFAYTVLWQLLPEVDVGRNASVLIDNIVGYIVKNGFYLIDVTGKPTSWGKWAPEVLNGDR